MKDTIIGCLFVSSASIIVNILITLANGTYEGGNFNAVLINAALIYLLHKQEE